MLKGYAIFKDHNALAGLILVAVAIFALILDNSPLYYLYDALLATPVTIRIGALNLDKPLLLWINDGLMAIFFFLIGLEIKRELLIGQLSRWRDAALPLFAAIGGIVGPALIFVAFNYHNPSELRGWAIPAATDIAFAMGLLALLGTRAPVALKIFLLALAIIDDLAAIVIIAIFYTTNLSIYALALASLGIAALYALNKFNVLRTAPYLLIGLFIWVCVLKSGVHATLAGVVTALALPLRTGIDNPSPLIKLEKMLHPWVLFAIMPVFAFANAGVSLSGLSLGALVAPLPLGIMLGLFVGKQLGVFGAAWLAIKSGICQKPESVSWVQLYGVSIIAGIGFTMSLFIGTLAFSDPEHTTAVRLGVLSGSFLSAIFGYLVLRFASQPQTKSIAPR